jgi:hypothetical protein
MGVALKGLPARLGAGSFPRSAASVKPSQPVVKRWLFLERLQLTADAPRPSPTSAPKSSVVPLMPIVPADTGAAAAIDIAHTIAALLHNHHRRSITLRTDYLDT